MKEPAPSVLESCWRWSTRNSHSIGLNDVLDVPCACNRSTSASGEPRPPPANNLSMRTSASGRDGEKLFCVFEHLGQLSPRFVSGAGRKCFARKFKRLIHLVDRTTIPLIASCMDWARHPAAAKGGGQVSLRLDLQSFLPRFCHCGHRPAQRRPARAGNVCRDQGR